MEDDELELEMEGELELEMEDELELEMEGELEQPSDVSDLMPCPLKWSIKTNEYSHPKWIFWSSTPNAELDYQRKKMAAAAPVVPTDTLIKSIFERFSPFHFGLIQFWAPVKVKASTFLSTADQPFALTYILDKELCTYRKLCLDTLIPIDINDVNGESLLGPPGRAFISGFPEYSPIIAFYSAEEFPLLQQARQSGIQTYCAIPVFKLPEKHCLGVLVFASKCSYTWHPQISEVFDVQSYELYSPCWPTDDIFRRPSERWTAALIQINAGLDVVRERHSLPLAHIWIPVPLPSAQIWIPDPQSSSIKALVSARTRSEDGSRSSYDYFHASRYCYIQSGKAVVGRAFSSQETCFCKDVTLLSLIEYPLVPHARQAEFTECFAICLRSKCANDFVFVVECFLPRNQMVGRDAEAFLKNLLSTMKEQLPGFIVASGKELGQRMVVEVVKVSPRDEHDSLEIGHSLPSVQSLKHGGETTEIDSLYQQSNLRHVENNVTSSHRPDSFNCERSVQVDTLVPRPTEEAVMVNLDVAHDDRIEFEKDRGEMIQPDSHFEQPNVEFDITGNARSNDKGEHNDIARCLPVVEAEVANKDSNIISGATPSTQRTDSQMSSKLPRIEKDHGITREKLEEQFGKTLVKAAEHLSVSRSTLKRICREHDITRWPHHKTRKVNHHASKGVALQVVEPYVEDQERPDLSREKGKDYLVHRPSPATGKACDSVMTLKVEYGDNIYKFKLTPESTREDLEAEVEKRLKMSLQKFAIKYQDTEDEWITIATDSDLRDGMDELRLLKRTTMRCKIVG